MKWSYPTRFLSVVVLAANAHLSAQTWETGFTQVGDDAYVPLDYPVVFVATKGHAGGSEERPAHFGLDVISANNPAPHGDAGGLWVVLPNSGQVKKLFPLPAHEAAPGLIDTPLGALGDGAVVEPNVSEDGRTIYFGWFHDQRWKKDGGGWQQLRLSYKGCDLYRLDLGPLIDDESVDPASLPVLRLTQTDYWGPPKAYVKESNQSKYDHAINRELAENSKRDYWGTVDMHLIEMRQADGLKAVWVSDRARVMNSNAQVGDANHNFNLYIADILPDGTLGPANRFQYYTTTSALSPAPLREGLAFSYQSSTEMFRRWDIQALTSNGRWTPLLGYGHSSELFHLGTYVVAPGPAGPADDHFIGLKYYNVNNGGFGQLHAVRLADAGVNRFDPNASFWATQPEQLSTLLTVGAFAVDQPSAQVQVGGQLRYVGKFSSPRAGRIGGEYLMAYTPTSANRWLADADGQKGVYDSYIAYRPSLEPFEPHEPVDVAGGKGLRTVVRDVSGEYDLIFPTPALSWMQRYGSEQQEYSGTIVDPESPVLRGEPHAVVGSSAIYNTDVRPYDCYKGGNGVTPWNPNDETQTEEERMWQNVEGLRYVQDPDEFCKYLQPETVLGISVNVTSNRVDHASVSNTAYNTDGNSLNGPDGHKEAVTLLGVYSPSQRGQSDASFKARVPADVPFEFHLLDSTYGMKLVDVRSWHSLKPRETRTDCGGCHQHEAGFGIEFDDTEASFLPPLDMTARTQFVTYSADCRPRISEVARPSLRAPEWKADVWPGFSQHCGSCHEVERSLDEAALYAFDYFDEESAYDQLVERRYATTVQGALQSPAFWAAYGARTDGRDNDLPAYQPDYRAGTWGFHFSEVHASAPGLCASSNPVWAEWVRTFGWWIDNHMPRDTGASSLGSQHDRFHPTVDFGVSIGPPGLRFGFWDDSGLPMVAEYMLNGVTLTTSPVPNGAQVVAPPSLVLTDRIGVVVTDAAGNRQRKEKTVRDLVEEFLSERL